MARIAFPSCDCFRIPCPPDWNSGAVFHANDGAFWWEGGPIDTLHIQLPGVRRMTRIPVILKGNVPDCVPIPWEWDGDLNHPTLHPSIDHWTDQFTQAWHGFLRNGRLEGC